MANDWIQTRSNKKLTPRSLRVEQVGDIEEIAHSLAHEFRFTRQTLEPYSVAEHCVRGARLLQERGASSTAQLAFLLHELSEVYLPDVPAPIKPYLYVIDGDGPGFGALDNAISWADLERQHTRVMLEALGLSDLGPYIESPGVRQVDLEMLAWEKRDLVGPEPEPWGRLPDPPSEEVVRPWLPSTAEAEFTDTYHRLRAESGR